MSNQNPFSEPGAAQGEPAFQPASAPRSNTNGILIGCLILALCIPVLGICAGLLLPAVQSAREAARRMSCSNNMKEIGLALHNYHTTHGSLPPAYTTDASGKPLHSWRTLILPYLSQESLYEQIDLTKPWDDPANQAIADTAVSTYLCPSTAVDPTLTTYVAVVHPDGMMSGPTPNAFGDISDGLVSTLLVAETDSGNAVHWMSPQDIDLPAFLAAGTQRDAGGHPGGAHILTGDGGVRFVTDSMSPQIRESLVLKSDGGGNGVENESGSADESAVEP